MEQEPIVSTLFSFVTTRSPQLLTEKERERGFIYFPNSLTSTSHFLDDLDDEESIDDRRTYLDGRLASYVALTTRQSAQNLHPELYEYSIWLMENKNTITIEQAAAKTKPTSLTNAEQVRLWNEIHYYTLSDESDAVREAVLRLIVANNFILKDDSGTATEGRLITTDEELQRLANAYVVVTERVLSNHPSRTNDIEFDNKNGFKKLEKVLDYFVAEKKIEVLSAVHKEFQKARDINEIENRKSFETAYQTYLSADATARDNATINTDEETGAETYDNYTPAVFTFTPQPLLESTYLDGKVSPDSLTILNRYINDGLDDEDKVEKSLNDELATVNEAYYKTEPKTKMVIYQGSLIKVRPNVSDGQAVISTETSLVNDAKTHINIILATGILNPKFASTTLSLAIDGDAGSIAVGLSRSNSSDNNLFLSFEYSGETITKDFNVSGTITLESGEEYSLDSNFQAGSKKVHAQATNEFLTAQNSAPVTLHGIEKIGVADFRRVEQEVCCYVPGEVSRIENILAKEYKERSTRQLISTETTTEEINETEIENLSDTTTSERSELASEISAIINQESSENYGASASVSGEIGVVKFGANAFYNGASASSSSNSNSQSQFEAEEITQRALERVVQKVTKRRTSRILREFEENNKHGFDNREGTEHVTGVYRWVDKIYTNRLVNYGKRLMYQFNVPEPSRFFKDAITEYIEGKEGTTTPTILGLQAPPIPDEFDISARSIHRWSYEWLSKKWGASVQPPPKEWINIGHSFSYAYQPTDPNVIGDDHELYSGNAEVQIPEGYYTVNAKATWNETADEPSQSNPHMEVSIGGQPIASNNGPLQGLQPHTITIPVSYSSHLHKAGSITITIKCKLTAEAYRKWRDDTFFALREAYDERVQEYNDWLYQNFVPKTADINPSERRREFNPLLNRALEKRELKRLAIYIMGKQFGITTYRRAYGTDNRFPYLNSGLDTHAKNVAFFEQCFEWEIMAYTFYPYFYGDLSEWKGLFAESNGTDPVFQAFLQSGMARMVVPVRPGFEKTVSYFLETGKIMVGDNIAIDRGDDLYLSIAEELEKPAEGVVEKEWDTRVPTDLTIVQANSAPLDANGLPCCDNEDPTENLGHGTSIMSGKDDTPQ